jgi:CRISPR-associated endonuclease/helicase Cas3
LIEPRSYYRYWGKAKPSHDSAVSWHLLVYHMLDTAAVCRAFLEKEETITRSISRSAGVSESTVQGFLPFLVALHDIGKFGESFQDLQPAIVAILQSQRTAQCYSLRHDALGYLLWSGAMCRQAWDEQQPLVTVESPSDDWDFHSYRDAIDPWIRATTGHHGQPPGVDAYRMAAQSFSLRAIADANEFVRDLIDLLEPAVLRFRDAVAAEDALGTSAWTVAGLVVLCDWIGSNQNYFPYRTDIVPLQDYWRMTLDLARVAVCETGVLPRRASTVHGVQGLFPSITEPSPVQATVESMPLGEGPQLFIIEDVTGSGKTEAAIVLAQRLISERRADGLYIALPTMATSNGMYRRLSAVYERIFDEGARASLVLTHSARHLDDAASDHCTVWLADHRKKALLAQAGVGTIDQALLAVLPAKHNVLRLFGLQRNVLIVDEVHAYDSYMTRILERLLEFHAALGGTAILLSATLPQATRQRFVQVFSRGLGEKAAPLSQDAYPLVTCSGADGLTELPLKTRSDSARSVNVEFMETREDAMAVLARAAGQGRCACWIRNSVNDALEGYEALRARLGEDRVTLFHARFMMGDRLVIENDVVKRFGPDSGSTGRSGQIVVATQVIEQSLDLDFDVMVSDLAPIDLLIQRAGRLRRHARDSKGQRVGGSDERGTPILHILAPHWSDDPGTGWVSAVLPRTARVYGHVGQLWLSMKVLRQRGLITVPSDARFLIESVFGDDALERIPDGLRRISDRFDGEQKAKASVAGFNALVLRDGYKQTATHWIEDTVTPTRLSEPTTTIRLARRHGGGLQPLFTEHRHPWEASQVSVRRAQLAQRAPGPPADEELIRQVEETMRDRGKWSVTLVLNPSGGGWSGRALDMAGGPRTVRYDKRLGLQIEKEESA